MRILTMALICIPLAIGCGSKKDGDATSPAEMGTTVGETQLRCMDDALKIVDGKNAADAKAPLIALRDRCITEMVALGKIRIGLSDVNAKKAIRDSMTVIGNGDMKKFEKFSEEAKRLRTDDNDLANMLVGFNNIAQYSDYELLKKQNPKEAERLGIQ